jgi:polysaccharide deacetylase family protein (PEP-CTERM system associated)
VKPVINAFTVDLEEWYQAELIRQKGLAVKPLDQVEEAVQPILDLLARAEVRATFFVVGEVMEQHPDLIRCIREQGHEIACHGMTHRPLWTMAEVELERDLSCFGELYTKVLGDGRPMGFRAPTFSLSQDTRWAVTVLRDFGYAYDSSVFPLRTPLYGVAGAPLVPYRISSQDVRREEPRGTLWEFPMTAHVLGGVRLPVSGGAYLRVLPYLAVKAFLRSVNRTRPFAVYVHPWEVYVRTPKVKGLGFGNGFATYGGRRRGLRKVRGLLRDFQFAPMCEVLSQWASGVACEAQPNPA